MVQILDVKPSILPNDIKPTEEKKPPKKNDETVINREITINIKEEIKLTGDVAKTGSVPLPIFNFNQMPDFNPQKIIDAKASIENIVKIRNSSDLSSLVKEAGKFTKSLEGMPSEHLLAIAEHIGDLLQNTDGNDDTLGELQRAVFDRLKPSVKVTYIPVIPTVPDMPKPADEKGNEKTEVSQEDLDWALNMQEKIKSGYKPTELEKVKYDDIFKRYKQDEEVRR